MTLVKLLLQKGKMPLSPTEKEKQIVLFKYKLPLAL